MKEFFIALATLGLMCTGVGSLLFILMWIDHDFDYAYGRMEALVRAAIEQ